MPDEHRPEAGASPARETTPLRETVLEVMLPLIGLVTVLAMLLFQRVP